VQKFSVHDGPGIRTTVFFKGCPLSCIWCHNPESRSFDADLMTDDEKCTGCGNCTHHCPLQAITVHGSVQVTDRGLCNACGVCADFCLKDSREIAGRTVSKAELLAEILKDRIFYEQSGGGVTFSGGEALCHIDTLEPLAAECRCRGLHVAIDTCGFVPQDVFHRILPHTNLFLYDLKQMNSDLHHRYTGQDNRLILENLRFLSAAGAAIVLRLPLIEGINASPDDIEAVLRFIKTLRILQVNLLPYHNTGSSKYAKLGFLTQSTLLAAPSRERLEYIQRQFTAAGLTTRIGG